MKKKSITISILSLILAASMLLLIGCEFETPISKFIIKKAEDTSTESATTKGSTNQNTLTALSAHMADEVELITVMSEVPTFLSDGEGGYTATVRLTATVLPAEASNKKVDWSVEWDSNATRKAEPVSDYVTVTPSSDGSTIADVTCKKAFEGDKIYIIVTTRISSYSARCTCIYSGIPTSLSITTADTSDNGIYHANSAITSTYNPILSNGFGVVGSGFTPSYSMTVAFKGRVLLEKAKVYTGTEPTYTERILTVTVVDVGNGEYRIDYNIDSSPIYTYMTCKLENGKINITGGKVFTSFFYYIGGSTSGQDTIYFKSFENDVEPYVEITLTETNTGISNVFKVDVHTDITSVELDLDMISF